MNVFKMKKLALALGSLVMLGASVQAQADPATGGSPFTIDPSAILPGGSTQYDGVMANAVNGSSSELLHFSSGGQVTSGNGYFNFGQFVGLPGQTIGASDTGLTVSYGMYLVFQLQATGTFGFAQTVTKLDFQLYADPGYPNKNTTRTTFTPAGAGAVGTEATVSQAGDDILLGYGTLISGVAGVDSAGGLFINSMENFALCNGVGTAIDGTTAVSGTGIGPTAAACPSGAGKGFFVAPNPFYQLAFDAFNNTTQNFTPNGDGTVAVSAAGTADFRNVPEPGTIALLGIAATALGVTSRRRNRK